jgi:hypothetical protein
MTWEDIQPWATTVADVAVVVAYLYQYVSIDVVLAVVGATKAGLDAAEVRRWLKRRANLLTDDKKEGR